MTVRLNPYLVMDGNAMEAIRFYEKALDAKVLGVMTFGDMPGNPDSPLPEAAKNRVAHALLKVGESDLMLSDTFPGQPLHVGNQVTVLITAKDKDHSRRLFEALKEGGRVDMPLQETSWSPAYGMLTDKFGVSFHVNTEGPGQGQ